ncbi:MAG: sulfotransferase, partial [Xenococcus sp. (in: cyanobacteria)]
MFPNFICIGAERSGSTWLYKNLKKHPEIWLPPVKEIHYFDEKEKLGSVNIWQRFFDKNSSLNRRWRRILKNQLAKQLENDSFDYQNIKWYFNYFFRPRNDQWYASLFQPDSRQKTGDITPAYSTLGIKSVAHIHKLMPDVKIIFILRNPMQRAWSHALKRMRDRNRLISVSNTHL